MKGVDCIHRPSLRRAYGRATAATADLNHRQVDFALAVLAAFVAGAGYFSGSMPLLYLGVVPWAASLLITAGHWLACRPCPRSVRSLYATGRARQGVH